MEIDLSILVRGGGGDSGILVGDAISSREKDLEFVIRAGRGRIQRDVARPVLLDGRCDEMANVVPAVRLDGNEFDHDLLDEQCDRRLSQAGRTLRRRRRENVF